MGIISIITWILALPVLLGCYIVIDNLIPAFDPREPALIPQPVPIIGHALGILRHGSLYYTKITRRYPDLPIYTLALPRCKIYIVTSPALVASIDRHAQRISFAPFAVFFIKRFLIPSQEALRTISEDLDGKNATPGILPEALRTIHDSLSPGRYLENTTREMLDSVSGQLEHALRERTQCRLRLFTWVRALITRASTDAIYGATKNPFRDPNIENAFWTIEKDFGYLGVNILPSLLSPSANQARSRLFQSFHLYYSSNGHENASRLVQARYEVHRKYNLSQTDIEHFDLSICYGLLVNTAPAMAWALYYMFSLPSVLDGLRTAISSNIQTTQGQSTNRRLHSLNIAAVVASYPPLFSFIHETLRVQSTNASGRVVLKDILVGGQYLLKKHSIVLIPSAELHGSQVAWGPSSTAFDPSRFLDKEFSFPASAYRAFGGGGSVCPGRHFAMNEIAIILVIVACKYDIRPKGDAWEVPECRPHIMTSILTPVADVEVDLVERPGESDREWCFSWDTEDLLSKPKE